MAVQVKTLRHPLFSIALPVVIFMTAQLSCSQGHEHIAPAVYDSDSLPTMTAHGISNLISDSGIISYKIVAEDWNIYVTEPQKWTFLKGLFLEKFDSTFHVQWYLQSDTAYCHANRIWELRGRVVLLNREGDLFETEELFWDMDAHEMWNNVFICITKPTTNQQLKGYNFRSDEQMTKYSVNNSAGYTPMKDKGEKKEELPSEQESGFYDDSRRPSQADSHRGSNSTSQVTRPQADSLSVQ